MGLRQGDSGPSVDRSAAPWSAVAIVAALVVVIGLAGDATADRLAFERTGIAAGEYWRLLSAHFVHLGHLHLLLNLGGLLLIAYLVGTALTRAEWLLALFFACITISVGLWVLQPDLERYVGLSGALHALLAAGLVATIGRWQLDLWIVASALAAKLLLEQLVGPLPVSESISGGNVIVDAHLYGAISGCISGGSIAIRVRTQASI